MPSICQDSVFKAFCTLISETREAHTWELVLCSQAYPDPRELLRDQILYSTISETEPGIEIDYQQTRSDGLQMGVTADQRLRIAKLCNDLETAHRNYVQAKACVEAYTLYDKMIDRFYRRVQDDDFQRFVASNNHTRSQMVWPRYEVIKETNVLKLNNWVRQLQRCVSVTREVKNSATTRQFLAKLHNLRLANIGKSTLAKKPPPATARPTLTAAERKLAIARRNRMILDAHWRANEDLRISNMDNPHQIGELGLHENSEATIAFISQKQREFKARYDEVKPGDLHWYRKQLEKGGMKPELVELALEDAKTVLETEQKVDRSKKLVFAEGYSNVARRYDPGEQEDEADGP